jgi:hypothetical protein
MTPTFAVLAPVRRCAKLELLPDTRKYIARGDSAGAAIFDGNPQGGKFGLVLLFLALQCAECGADNLARIFVAPALDFLEHKAIKFAAMST